MVKTSTVSWPGAGKGCGHGRQGLVLTVEALLVHDGAAAQGLVVLLVAHKRVHTQDSCRDMGRGEVHDAPLSDGTASRARIFHTPKTFAHRNGKRHLHNNFDILFASISVTLQSLSSA